MTLGELLNIERRLVGIDLETTSANPDQARIVQIGLEIHQPGREVIERETLVNPGVEIPQEAYEKHLISNAMVADAPTFKSMAVGLRQVLSDCDFAGFNVRYDLKILAAEFKRAGVTWSREGAGVVDSFRLWQVVSPRSLDDASEEFLTDEDRKDLAGRSHTALYDVKRSTRVAVRQLLLRHELPRDVAKLHALLNPGEFDADGKLTLDAGGTLRLNFGLHKGKTLYQVPRDYLKWMIRSDFSEKVKAACEEACR